MKTKWLALLLLAITSFSLAGCAGQNRGRYRQPGYGPGYYRYDPRYDDRHHRRHDRRDHRWDDRYADRIRGR